MNRLRYRTSVAVAVLSIAIAQATLGKHSFSSSIIASALSKLHGVKDSSHMKVAVVATSAKIDTPVFLMGVPHAKVSGAVKEDVPPTKPVNDGDTGQGTGATPVKKGDPQAGAGTQAKTETKAETKAETPPKTAPPADGLIDSLYADEDIKSVISEVASLANVSIIPDETIKPQQVSVEFKRDTIDSVMDKLATMAGAYWKMKRPGFYVISKATPDASLFREFAETKIYKPQNLQASSIQLLLSASYKPYVSVDPKSNAIGVSAPQALLDKILADIALTDITPRQIEVEALVTEVTLEDSLASGVTASSKSFSLGSDLSLNYATNAFTSMATIKSLITNHKANLRSNPRIMSVEGAEANVNVGTDTYYSLLSGSTTFPTSQIQLIHTGVILKYTAFIGADGYITMQLDPEVSDAVVLTNGNPSSQVRRASTKVRVKSGEPIMIAGLIQETVDNQVSRVPILGYIPLIGELFTQRSKDKKKVETIIMITPRIVP